MRKLSYRAAASQALEYTNRRDWPADVTAWLNAADAAGRYESETREMCGREAVRCFNAAYIRASGDREDSHDVFYWPGAREGEGKRGRTRGAAYMMCGTAMIGIEGVAGGIALSHVLVISEGK